MDFSQLLIISFPFVRFIHVGICSSDSFIFTYVQDSTNNTIYFSCHWTFRLYQFFFLFKPCLLYLGCRHNKDTYVLSRIYTYQWILGCTIFTFPGYCEIIFQSVYDNVGLHQQRYVSCSCFTSIPTLDTDRLNFKIFVNLKGIRGVSFLY